MVGRSNSEWGSSQVRISGSDVVNVPLRRFGAVLCAAVFGAVVLAGCGDSSPSDDAKSDTPAAQDAKADQKASGGGVATGEKGGSGAELPDGFPYSIPLPLFTEAKPIASGDNGMWVFMLILKNSTDDPVADYAAQLTDAGYDVTEGASMEARGQGMFIAFHSSMKNTLTVSVIED